MQEEILLQWNPWWSGGFDVDCVDREAMERIKSFTGRKEVVPVTGCRRSGKTTLLYMTIKDLLETVPKENILFIKCDDERVGENVIEEARSKHLELFNPGGRTYMFLDEVQEAEGWERTVKRLFDLEKDLKIFLTGSGLLKEEISTSLAGRYLSVGVYPFSFGEFLRAKGTEPPGGKVDLLSSKDEIKHYLREYLEWGGFPEIALEKDEDMKRELLRFYSDSILYRDVVRRAGINKPDKLEALKGYLLANVSNLLNYNKIAKHLSTSPDTVASYMHALESAYFLFSVPLFSYSMKKQQVNPKKIYCIDNGIRNTVGLRFSRDVGRLYENTVFVHLKRMHNEIYYWKDDNGEVNFLVKEGKDVTGAIQVCYDLESARDRELRPLLSAMHEFALDEALVITGGFRHVEKIDGKNIRCVPLWEWLMT